MITTLIYLHRLCQSGVVILSLLLTANLTTAQNNGPSNVLRITMVRGTARDEIVIDFRSDATAGFDYNADAWKLFNGSFDLSSMLADGSKLAINSLPPLDSQVTVKLAVDNVALDDYEFDFADYESFPDSVSIVLSDKFTNKQFDVRKGGGYPFSVTSDSASLGDNRFQMIFSILRSNNKSETEQPAVITQIEDSNRRSFSVYPNPVNEEVFVEIENNIGSENEIKIYNSLGQLVTTIELHRNLTNQVGQFNMRSCQAGLYIVRFQNGETTLNKMIIKN